VVAAVRRPADVAGSQEGRTSVPGLAAPRPLTRRCTHARSAGLCLGGAGAVLGTIGKLRRTGHTCNSGQSWPEIGLWTEANNSVLIDVLQLAQEYRAQ